MRPHFFRSGLLLPAIFLACFTSASAGNVNSAGPDEGNLVKDFFRNLYDFSFQRADSLVSVLEEMNADHSTLLIIRADLAWWRLLSGEETELNMKICNDNIEESIKTNLKYDHPDINTLFNIIYSYSLKVRLENYKGNSLSAFINFYRSSAFIEKCRNMNIKDEKFAMVLGMYYYFISYIEHKYFLLNTLLFSLPSGDRDKGLSYLVKCSGSSDDVIRTEADYFLMKIYSEAEKEYSKALGYARIITEMHPDNPVYSLDELRLMMVMKQYREATVMSKELVSRINRSAKLSDAQKKHFLDQVELISKRR